MSANRPGTPSIWRDTDDAPELTDTFFDEADLHRGQACVRRGRPRSARPRVPVSLRLPADVLARWKASGAGWQTRMIVSLTRHAPKD